MTAVTTWRRIAAIAAGAVMGAIVPAVAHADAAGPTDYRTTVVSIDPPLPGLEVSIEGGDAFVRLRAPDGVDVVVLGYAGEPYLRIAADGAVATNRLSAATYENEQRDGGADLPDIVDPRAEPEWVEIGTGGAWSWHDHRAHWMGAEPPVGLAPGESLPVQTIPVIVGGQPVVIAVETTLVPAPSWLPAAIGALVGLQLVALGWWLGPATATLSTMLLAIAALVAGGAQYLSLPDETGPHVVWWLLPAIAVASGIVSIATYGRSAILVSGLLALSGVQLLIWAELRRDGLTKPVLPTEIAFWFDRAVTAAALVAGAAIAFLAIRSLLRPPLAGPGPGDGGNPADGETVSPS